LYICRPDFFIKKTAAGFLYFKKVLHLQSQIRKLDQTTIKNEKDVSAIQKEENKQARFQGKDVNPEWKKSSRSTQGKGKEEVNSFQ
jgi:hypothetical protein